MFDWFANSSTTFTASNLRAGTGTGTINNRWITTVTGKVGFAWDRLLAYGIDRSRDRPLARAAE